MQITTRTSKGCSIIDLKGRLYLGAATKELRETFHEVAKKDSARIIINMRKVTHIDTPGLGELVSCRNHAEDRGEKLVLLNPQDKLINLLVMTKLITVFDIFHDEALAVGNAETKTVPA